METEALKNKASSPPKEWTPLELAEMKTGKYLGPIHRPKGFSNRRRMKPEKGPACFQVMSRTVYSKAFLQQLRNELKSFRERGIDEAAEKLLRRFKDRFCDVSLFVKELKERFSRWFNKQNGRRGTLWMDRFKSVCVDGEAALATMAAYIDLNPVRAEIVDDPMLYEWRGYGEAAGGSKRTRRGLCKALNLPRDAWEGRGMAWYRLFYEGESPLAL